MRAETLTIIAISTNPIALQMNVAAHSGMRQER